MHRFQFEPDALEVVIAGKEEQETENAFVGGRNRCARARNNPSAAADG
jgi:hypothetical protein